MSSSTQANTTHDDPTDLSTQYDTPLGLAHTTMQALKDRIKLHYDLASDYYLNLWGEHIHHGYWPTDASKSTDSKETAQLNLIRLLLSVSDLSSFSSSSTSGEPKPLRILDVGCGVGGTTRFLASELGAEVTGITISGKQVQIARRLSKSAAGGDAEAEFTPLGSHGGKVRFLELDAEKMGEFFSNGGDGSGKESEGFDVVWISEALSHFPNKALFFRNSHKLLRKAGRDISWSLVQNPSLWAFAFSQGRDGIAFLQAFRAMRRGYANGSFRYAVMAFVKPSE
ncbi:hypothetical protein N0V88_002405 [Collariella sp. IMI 366227]|nr:hypothetical protein N0V88_002405 [Collariella sp. IMI 366227]